MALGLDEVIELKKLIQDKYGKPMHMHDSCAGQYFSFDEPIEGIEETVQQYLDSKGHKGWFAQDRLTFTAD